ncbi:MAG TPA: enoyl-CoA hydratase-related protein [Vineibacter sp.]|nr:enoyl-CoA hydratase-related protein [Vineibacter sp.]
MADLPALREFRTETTRDGILHLVFDMPGRSMNVFSNAAIHEIEAFATWLHTADVRGVVIRSGKASAFCVGADLGELGVAYDMIVAAPPAHRKRIARDHFAPIGRAFRRLETAGKPVAAAIHGLALGGGCELALGTHYRVLTDTPQTALGLPESLVGLLPGGGGTQRLPRLIGLEKSLPVLLNGARLSPADALAAGATDAVVPAGDEVTTAERWVRAATDASQPWDRPDWRPPSAPQVRGALTAIRQAVLDETGGHYPAPLAILDCLARGLPQTMDAAIAEEIDVFADLIKRPEPRNMIQTLFLGKQDYDKRRKAGTLPDFVAAVLSEVGAALNGAADADATSFAGFAGGRNRRPSAAWSARDGIWFEQPESDIERRAAVLMTAAANAVRARASVLSGEEQRLADYAAVKELGFPAYAGGPFAVLARLG